MTLKFMYIENYTTKICDAADGGSYVSRVDVIGGV